MKRITPILFSLLTVLLLCTPASAAQEEKSYTFTFAGDCTFGCTPENYYAQMGFVKTVGDDYGYPFRNVLTYFEDDDLSIVNLEGPLTDVGVLVEKKFNFRGPPEYAQILTQNSIEAVSVANNHTMDYGQEGYAATLAALDAWGVPYVERDAGRVVTLPDGLKVGLYGMVYYRYPEAEELQDAFDGLKAQGAQVIIFLPHWGWSTATRPMPSRSRPPTTPSTPGPPSSAAPIPMCSRASSGTAAGSFTTPWAISASGATPTPGTMTPP